MCSLGSERKEAPVPASDKYVSHRYDISIIPTQDMNYTVGLMQREECKREEGAGESMSMTSERRRETGDGLHRSYE